MARTKNPLKAFEKVLGVKFDPSTFVMPTIDDQPLDKNQPLHRQFSAEAVLATLEKPETPKAKRVCKQCKDAFYTSYKSVAYCSDECRRGALSAYGLDWGFREKFRSQSETEIWGGYTPPFIIPPEALAVMKYLVETAENLQGRPIEPWSSESKPSVVSQIDDSPVTAQELQLEMQELSEALLQPTQRQPSLAELLADLD